MRLVVDLHVDPAGRPVGTVRRDDGASAERFADWLDLLRVLEGCIDTNHRIGCPKGER